MTALLIRGGRIIDPANHLDAVGDVLIESGRVRAVGKVPRRARCDEVIDAGGLIVCPGFVDLSVRLREPGQDHKATIASETRAALAAGVTTLCCPPDTSPVIDTPAVVELIHQRAMRAGAARVLCLGALTQGLKGEMLAQMHSLKCIGCVGLSNALQPIASAEVLRRALEYAASVGMTVFLHALDPWLSGNGLMHEGATSTRLGLAAIPETAETVALARDLLLIEQTGARAHFCRLSSARAAALVAAARRRRLPVTADVGIAYLHCTDADVDGFDSLYHVQPPLRGRHDRLGLRRALQRGIIDAVCSDHQPHEPDAKRLPFGATEAGMSTLEAWLPLMLALVRQQGLPLARAIDAMTAQPAAILGIAAGTLAVGTLADLCIFDPDADWILDETTQHSAGRNSPWLGKSLRGRVRYTVMDGAVVHRG